ncbi:unnamed protein product [Pleuronectes platessa]|uniref:Uncharacterized protein n=1 Tax=Pleuronectes platessa TaxID=8262 RepID=A0A9N7YY41_PLEPL|nr:unnamed protein product [Pleuronectes platessa]
MHRYHHQKCPDTVYVTAAKSSRFGRLHPGIRNICQRRQSLKWDTASACVLPSLICMLSIPPPSIALWHFWVSLPSRQQAAVQTWRKAEYKEDRREHREKTKTDAKLERWKTEGDREGDG